MSKEGLRLRTKNELIWIFRIDTPAWVVSAANQYAIDHGKTPFVIYQGVFGFYSNL